MGRSGLSVSDISPDTPDMELLDVNMSLSGCSFGELFSLEMNVFSISNDKSSPCMILMTWVHVCVVCAVCLCRTLVD